MKKLYYKTTAAIAVLGLTAVTPASVCMAAEAAIPADNNYIMEGGYDGEILEPGQILEDADMMPGKGEEVGVNIDVGIEEGGYEEEIGYDEETLRPGQILEDVDMTPGEGEAVGINIDVDIDEASPEPDQSVPDTANMISENKQEEITNGNNIIDGTADTKNRVSQMPSVSKTAAGSSYHIESAASKAHAVSGSYTVTANLRLRKGAGTTKDIILVMNRNAVVNCYGYYTEADGTKWLLVQYLQDGQEYTGFCSSEYLRR